LTLATLAAAFQVSRQGAALLVRKHGYAIVADPDALWLALLENGNASPLRSRLSDPRFRQAAADQLAIGRRYNRIKKGHGGDRKSDESKGQNVTLISTEPQPDNPPKPTTAEALA
jgi:hypothetical protein